MGYIRHTRLGMRAHTEGPTVHAARVQPLVFSLPPQVRSLRQLDELMRQLVKVVPRAESSALPVPQPAPLAAWGWAFSALGCASPQAAHNAQGPGPRSGTLRCCREIWQRPAESMAFPVPGGACTG